MSIALSGLLPSGWFDGFAGFAWPWAFAALPLPWLVRMFWPPVPSREQALRTPWDALLPSILNPRIGPARSRGAPWWLWAAWALLCLAAARPQQFGAFVQPPQSSRDLMVALDLSESMHERDMELGGRRVDRLTAAKAVMSDFLDRRQGDRVGMVVFGERAYVLTPLTRDLRTVRLQFEDTVSGMVGAGTAIGDAIALAARRLRAQPASQRVLVLLTDGVNTAGGLEPAQAAELARRVGVRVHTIAFGGYGNGVSIFGLPFRVPSSVSQTDEATLQKVADITGGRAFKAYDVEQLAEVYAMIDRLEPVARPGERLRPRLERYVWPLAASMGILLLFGLLWPAARGARRPA